MELSRNLLFLIVFAMMALQMLLSMFQIKRYQKELNRLRGTGTIGIGHTKGSVKLGQILIVSYNQKKDVVVACQRMRGLTIFAGFKPVDSLVGKSLGELKDIAVAEDAREFKHRRKKHPYDKNEMTKKKGALIQAVEAIEKRMAQDLRKSTGQESLLQSARRLALEKTM